MKLRSKKLITLFLGLILVMSMAFAAIGCGSGNQVGNNQQVQNTEEAQVTVLGEGATQFAFTVIDKDGNETNFEIHTDKEIVGDALLELELIAGDESEYGLFVKSVNGIIADYNEDQTYWAFYVNGEYATIGVDTTPIEAGKTYTFKVEK